MIDQFRADLMDAYGGNPNLTTPNLDRLASEGALFTNAVAAGPLCTPARGMFHTGLYPTHSGVVMNWVEVNPNQRTIAHIFRDAGYATGFIGKWHLAAGAYKTAARASAVIAVHRDRGNSAERGARGEARAEEDFSVAAIARRLQTLL